MARDQTKERRAKNEVVEGNPRLLISIAKRYSSLGLQLADSIQKGNIGLMRAVEEFEYRRCFKFSTYRHLVDPTSGHA